MNLTDLAGLSLTYPDVGATAAEPPEGCARVPRVITKRYVKAV